MLFGFWLVFLWFRLVFLESMSTKVLRNSSEQVKYEDIIETKLLEFSKNLATKQDIEEIKTLFTTLTERIDYQDRKIASLEKETSDHEERIAYLENNVNILVDKNAVLSSSVDFLMRQSDSQE